MTKTLLTGGLIAGPFYLAVSFIQVFSREGFDITRHPLSLLSNGELGWIHIANLIISGLLVIGAAIGMHSIMKKKERSVWGPLLISIYGIGLVCAGIFRADPAMGFPPGAPETIETMSTSGILHFISGGVGFLGLIAACFVFARQFGIDKEQGWKISSIATGFIILVGFIGIASGASTGWTILGFWIAVAVGWMWLSSLSGKMKREFENS